MTSPKKKTTAKESAERSAKGTASTSARSAGAGGAATLIVQRGGERFDIEEAAGLFAVKRRAGTARGVLADARNAPGTFPALEFQPEVSTREIEVFRVDAESRDDAMARLREQRTDVEWCAHVYHVPGDPDGVMVPTDRIYVELAPGAEPAAINPLLEEHHLELMPADDDDPRAFVLRLTSASTKNPIKIANDLVKNPGVRLAEPDFAMKVKLAYRPTDTLFHEQWHLENLGGFGLTAGADVRAPAAWDITRGRRSVRVCVMDDGVQTDHPDFAAPGKVVAPFDFGQNDADPRPVLTDDNHGTSCAGVAVAEENGDGVVGIAPGCALMPYRTSGMISDATIKALFDSARQNGADVISCSWGVNAVFFTLSTAMNRAIERAAKEGRDGRGSVIVFASGNEDSPVNGVKDGVMRRSGFAIHPDVIAVNASNSHDVRSHYSNYGPETWVCAPSSGSGGRRIVTTDRTGGDGYQTGDYTTVNGFGGTSSSCPLVAGICGLMLSVNAELTSAEVKEILRDTADEIDLDNGNYGADGHSDWYGYGRINAFRAVQEAERRLQPTTVRRVSFERTPGLAIPDRLPAGVADSITVAEAATVRSVEVAVDIEHTYRGDLVVHLLAPDGEVVTLHDREGGGGDDLVATFTADGVPGLAGLAGRSALGTWTLQVQDLATADVGTLVRWTLTLGLAGGPRTEWQASPGAIIPDDDPAGIASEIAVEEAGELTDIELGVDITHTWRGDLEVVLETPSGLRATVHQRTGGSADDLVQSYRPADTPALQDLVAAGVDIQGTWTLRVADRAARDLGKLNAWTLRLGTRATTTLVPTPTADLRARRARGRAGVAATARRRAAARV